MSPKPVSEAVASQPTPARRPEALARITVAKGRPVLHHRGVQKATVAPDQAPKRNQLLRRAISASMDRSGAARELHGLIKPTDSASMDRSGAAPELHRLIKPTDVVDAAMMPHILGTIPGLHENRARLHVSRLVSQLDAESYPRPIDFLIALTTAARNAVIGKTLSEGDLLSIHRAIHGNLPAEDAAALLDMLITDAVLTTAPAKMLIAAATACRGNRCSPDDKRRLLAAISTRSLGEADDDKITRSELIEVYAAIHHPLRHHAVLEKLIDEGSSTGFAYIALAAAAEACDDPQAVASNVRVLATVVDKAFGSDALKDEQDDLTRILLAVSLRMPRHPSALPVLRTLVTQLMQLQRPDPSLMHSLLGVLGPMRDDEAGSLRGVLRRRIRTERAPAAASSG